MASKLDRLKAGMAAANSNNTQIEQYTSPTEEMLNPAMKNTREKNLDITPAPAGNVIVEKIVENESTLHQKSDALEKVSDNDSSEKKSSLLSESKRILEFLDYDLHSLSTWGTNINVEILELYEYYAAVHDIKRYDLINCVLHSERVWEENNPGFPSKEFVLQNIKKRGNKDDSIVRSKTTFLLDRENNLFLKKTAARCGMKMYEFLEYILPLYLNI